MDWGDVVVHVMTTEQREYYALEGGKGLAVHIVVSPARRHGLVPCAAGAQCAVGWPARFPGDCPAEPRLPSSAADFYGAAEEVALPFDQSEDAAAVDSWTKKL